MLPATERPLTGDERAALAIRIENARAQSRGSILKTGAASAFVCGVLALVTIALSDAPTLVIVLFWSGLAVIFVAWIGLPWQRLMRDQVRMFQDARDTNRARVIRIQSSRVVEFEEEEDEGACYAFGLRPDATVFIVGQEFYEDDDFPNSDFSMIEILGRSGLPVDVLTSKHGHKLTPERVVPASVKRRLELPEHLALVGASVDRIEDALAHAAEP